MKKLFITLAASVAALGAYAQTQCENKVCNFAPQQGDFSIEILMDPFKNGNWFSATETFGVDALKARYFVTDNDAVLLQLGINGTNKKVKPDTDEDAYSSEYSGQFMLSVGYERHFCSYKRLDPFAGASFFYKREFSGNRYETDNKNYSKSTTGANGFGFDFFAGFDFYLYKGLFCGVQLGMTLEDMMAPKTTVNSMIAGTKNSTDSKEGGHDFSFTTKVQPLIRLGWKF